MKKYAIADDIEWYDKKFNKMKIIEILDSAIRKAHGEGWDYVDLSIEDAREILVALRQDEPRVLTLEEAEDRLGDYIHIEIRGKNVGEYRMLGELDSYSRKYRYLYVLHPGGARCTPYSYHFINKIWRPWSAQPTEEQMRDTPWEVEDARSSENNTPS